MQLEAKAVAKEMLQAKPSALQLKKDALSSIAHLPVVAISSVGKGCSFLTLPIGILKPATAK